VVTTIQAQTEPQVSVQGRILVTYASKAGSTAEVAVVIGEVLSGRGYAVDVKPIQENPSVAGYQAVIVGSAIRMGNWLPAAVEFVKNNQDYLSQTPTAFFTCHRLNTGDDETSRRTREAYTAPVRLILTPQAEVFFSGDMDYSKLKFVDRTLAKAVEKATHTPAGDYRDWSKIRAWAGTVFA
jgi:menaquinone-dependent protoporphyrinogen oxidase